MYLLVKDGTIHRTTLFGHHTLVPICHKLAVGIQVRLLTKLRIFRVENVNVTIKVHLVYVSINSTMGAATQNENLPIVNW